MSAYRVAIRVMPRAGLLDPQGPAVEPALPALGFGGGRGAHVGKHLVVEISAPSREAAAARARAMCERLLANPVTEDFEVAVEDAA